MTAVTFIPLNISADQDRGAWVDSTKQAGVTLTIGEAVRLDSNNVLQKAQGNSAANARVYGIVVGGPNTPYGETTIAANGYPAVCIAGEVFVPGTLISTTPLAAGQLLYLSNTTAGGLVDTAPTPNAYQTLVARATGNDSIYVMPGITAPVSV